MAYQTRRAFLASLGIAVPAGLAEGVILGTVDLVDCQPYAGSLKNDPLAEGEFCWILKNPRPFVEPIAARGKLSIWTCQLPAE